MDQTWVIVAAFVITFCIGLLKRSTNFYSIGRGPVEKCPIKPIDEKDIPNSVEEVA